MTKIKKICTCLLISIAILSCSEDEEPIQEPPGQAQLTFSDQGATKNQVFQLRVLDSGGDEVALLSDLTELPTSIELEDGSYKITVQSQNASPLTTNDVVFSGESQLFEISRADNITVVIELAVEEFEGWIVVPDVPFDARDGASSFMIGNNIYMGLGFNSEFVNSVFIRTKDWWKYSVEDNSWEQLDDFPGGVRSYVRSFTTGNKGYLCLGYEDGDKRVNELWEFDPGSSNSWTRLTDFPGIARDGSVAMVNEDKVYLGSGIANGIDKLNDFYSYNINTNEWLEIAEFPGSPNSGAVSFTIDGEAHLLGGASSQGRTNIHYKYNPMEDKWIELTPFPGTERLEGVTFNLDGVGYFGLGSITNNSPGTDLWKFNAETDSWDQVSPFAGEPRFSTISGSNGVIGYYGLGRKAGIMYNDLYLYYPESE